MYYGLRTLTRFLLVSRCLPEGLQGLGFRRAYGCGGSDGFLRYHEKVPRH